MIILGIDPGTARMGYGVLDVEDADHVTVLDSATLITSKDLEDADRLNFLYRGLSEISKKYKPELMIVEKLFFNVNVKTALSVGQARGVCLLVSSENHMKLQEYTALEAKKTLTGYGRADKKQMQEAVKDILKLEKIVKSDDANDGVAIALCYILKKYNCERKNED